MQLKKKYILYFVAISFVLLAFSGPTLPEENPKREELLMELVLASLKQGHYQSIQIDDELSKRVFDSYLERVDNGKRFFLKSDVEAFTTHRLLLDDYALSKNFEFFDIFSQTFDERTKQAGDFYKEILSEPFDFSKEESIETDAEKMDFAEDNAELKSRWTKLLKYR
ncbi:MAG: hypothetical protein QNK78_09930, partial [Crocinitomicaceae bacterium]